MSTDTAPDRGAQTAALRAQLDEAAALIMDGTERDRATALLLRMVGGIIEAIDDRPLGLLPMRARTLADTIFAEHEASETADELRKRANMLYRRSDNVPLSRDGSGVDRVAELRTEADALMAHADKMDA